MSATRNGTRREPYDVYAANRARLLAAEISAAVDPLVRKALADPNGNWQELSNAYRLAAVGAFYTGYVAMFEKRNP